MVVYIYNRRMALYIHPENQELLWKVVNKNPVIEQYFTSYPANIQESWFKQIISSFYEQNRQNVSNSEQLYEINKNTLTYMVQDINRNIQYIKDQRGREVTNENTQVNKNTQINQNMPMGQNDFLKPHSITENKEDRFTNQYNQYQQNYQSMFDKKVPESIDFRENFDDQPISGNMDELVQRHLRERDEELKRYAMPSIMPNLNPVNNNNNQIQSQPFFGQGLKSQPNNFIDDHRSSEKLGSNRLIINNSPENVKISVEEIPSSPYQEKEEMIRNGYHNRNKNENYTLKWLDNENSEKINCLENEINMLKNQVLQMSDKISFLINANKDIFDFSAQKLKMSPNTTIKGGFLFDPNY